MKHLLLIALLGILYICAAPTAISATKWPMEIIVNDAEISIFQPQLEKFAKNKITARCAISIQTKKSTTEMYCTVWFSANTIIDKTERIVKFKNVHITELAFPGVPDKVKDNMGKIIYERFLNNITQMELDRFLPMLVSITRPPVNKDQYSNPPPQLFFSKQSAILVSIDGAPKLKKNNDNLMQVINTPFLIVLNMADKTYYLNCVNHWYSAAAATGPWSVTTKVPATVQAQQKVEQQKIKNSEQGTASPAKASNVIPKIFVATRPAELIQSSGEPVFATIPGTQLLYVENSTNDIFQDLDNEQYYILLSGRWFIATSKAGLWKYIASKKTSS